jgi:hypothetical protein
MVNQALDRRAYAWLSYALHTENRREINAVQGQLIQRPQGLGQSGAPLNRPSLEIRIHLSSANP